MSRALLHHFDQKAEGRFFGRLWMNEKDRRAARTRTGSVFHELKAVLLQVVVGFMDIFAAQGHMHETAASAVFFYLF
jgi:hypothetical protein